MPEKNKQEKNKQEESTPEKASKENPTDTEKKKTKLTLGKGHVAMLSVSATVLVFILAFSCYGCSYQPIIPPTPEEAKVTLDSLYNSIWALDTTAGVPTLPEMQNMVVERFEIRQKQGEAEGANATMYIQGRPSVQVKLIYQEGEGFVLQAGSTTFKVKLLYSASKDGKNETLTMIGNESNTHCYYLKK